MICRTDISNILNEELKKEFPISKIKKINTYDQEPIYWFGSEVESKLLHSINDEQIKSIYNQTIKIGVNRFKIKYPCLNTICYVLYYEFIPLYLTYDLKVSFLKEDDLIIK
jgi:hypothetical protein